MHSWGGGGGGGGGGGISLLPPSSHLSNFHLYHVQSLFLFCSLRA